MELDKNVEAFMVHVSSLGLKMSIHPVREAQLALLMTKEVTVPTEYSDFADFFLEKSANVLQKRTRANKHAIKLEKSKQLSYGPIYSLGPVELKTLKIYIKTNLSKGFIRALELPADSPVIFVRKPDDRLCLYINYRGLNNIMIKNWYPFSLIGKSLDRLG